MLQANWYRRTDYVLYIFLYSEITCLHIYYEIQICLCLVLYIVVLSLCRRICRMFVQVVVGYCCGLVLVGESANHVCRIVCVQKYGS
jgi:hypothetical protein